MTRRDLIEITLASSLVIVCGGCRYLGAPHVATFLAAPAALALLARLVGTATDSESTW